MKMINKLIVPVTASALLLGACGASATDSKENTLISSKAGDVTVADTMKKIGKDQIANASSTEMLNKILADKYKNKVNDKKIDEQIEKMQKQYGGKDKFEKALQQQG
ncbi:TPA: peptidylprolyl isomerase, partial [Staphylococcus aureus]|nr:peptidylprolyl isomerase [Staphylococcus aureus]